MSIKWDKLCTRLSLLGTALALSSLQPAGAAESQSAPIARAFGDFTLGMTLSQAKQGHAIALKPDPVASLYRKYFGEEEAKKQETLNKAIDRTYWEFRGPKRPLGASTVFLHFLAGVLYQVDLHFDQAFIKNHDWDTFTQPVFNLYGEPSVHNNAESLSSVSYTWQDAQTKLEIAKALQKGRPRATTLSTVLYNVFLSDRRMLSTVEEALKDPDEESPESP